MTHVTGHVIVEGNFQCGPHVNVEWTFHCGLRGRRATRRVKRHLQLVQLHGSIAKLIKSILISLAGHLCEVPDQAESGNVRRTCVLSQTNHKVGMWNVGCESEVDASPVVTMCKKCGM